MSIVLRINKVTTKMSQEGVEMGLKTMSLRNSMNWMKMMKSLMKITHPCLDDDDQENDDEDS